MAKKITLPRILVYAVLIATAASTIYPIFFMILSAFKDRHEYMQNMFGLPAVLNFSNFRAIFISFDIFTLMYNSFVITIIAVIVSLMVNSAAAFSLTKLKYRGRDMFLRLFMFVLFVPGLALMMPIFVIISNLGLVNTFLGIILIHVATSIAFGTFLLVQNCRSIPDEIIESAKIDGASYPKIYQGIVLPMLKPTLTTLAVLNFLAYWNEVVYSRLILQETALHTMTLGIMTLSGRYGTNMPLLMAGLLINMLPALAIFLIFNKHLSRGITMGSLK